MTETIIVIGNGESRKNINFNNFNNFKIGCNAVYRDYNIDILICVDRRMVTEALENNFRNIIYTREDWIDLFQKNSNVKVLPNLPYEGLLRADNSWHWGSGSHACNIAASMTPKEIHLYGFDIWGIGPKINNIYKGTENYDDYEHHSIDPRYWIYQLAKCFEIYKNIEWIQYQSDSWIKPEEWNFPNLIIRNI